MDPIRGGDYDQWATLHDVPGATRDPYGQPSPDAVPIGQFWVAVRPLGGAELVRERQVGSTATHVIRLPYTRDAIPPHPPHNPDGRIVPSMKFSIRKRSDPAPRWFNVVWASDREEKGVEWECRCEEKPGASG